MDSATDNDYKAEEWMNDILDQLDEGQDFKIYEGDSEPLIRDGKKVGIRITRPHIEFFATGITKLYELVSDEDNKEEL